MPQDVTTDLSGLLSTEGADREASGAGGDVHLLGTFGRQEIRVNT